MVFNEGMRGGACWPLRPQKRFQNWVLGEGGSWRVNWWESLGTKFGRKDQGWAKTFMNQRDSLRGQEEDILRGSEKQTISKIQFPLLKKPLPNSNFSDQRDSHHFDLCANHFPPSLIPDGSLRVVGSICMTPHFTPKKCAEGGFRWKATGRAFNWVIFSKNYSFTRQKVF